MNESQIPITAEDQSDAEKSTELINFEKIKSPDELLSFMEDNIEYGFVSKDGKLYSPKIEDWRVGESPGKKLQSPEELLESKHGTCWEQTELERHWFEKQEYEFKTFIFMFGKDVSKERPAHSMLAYKKNDKWWWFEHAFGGHEGNHDFDNLDELIEEVKKIVIESALDAKATKEDIEKFKMYEYKTHAYGLSDDEFLEKVEKNDLLIDSEKHLELDS